MPEAEGGLPIAVRIWSLAADPPPLSLRDISPRKGGRGDPAGGFPFPAPPLAGGAAAG